MTGSDLLAMPPNIVEEYFRNRLRQKHFHAEGPLKASDFRRVLTPRQNKMLQEFEDLAAKEGVTWAKTSWSTCPRPLSGPRSQTVPRAFFVGPCRLVDVTVLQHEGILASRRMPRGDNVRSV